MNSSFKTSKTQSIINSVKLVCLKFTPCISIMTSISSLIPLQVRVIRGELSVSDFPTNTGCMHDYRYDHLFGNCPKLSCNFLVLNVDPTEFDLAEMAETEFNYVQDLEQVSGHIYYNICH